MKRLDSEFVTAFVAVGSNIDPENNILRALEMLKRKVDVQATSAFYRTPPIDRPDQPMFYNGVWKVQSDCGARELKSEHLRNVEELLGRERTQDSHAARSIDLDLILYGDQSIDEPGLKIPDADIYSRAFIAIPLMELSPHLRLPDSNMLISSLPIVGHEGKMELLSDFSEMLKQRLAR